MLAAIAVQRYFYCHVNATVLTVRLCFFASISAGFGEIRNGEPDKTCKYTAHMLLKA
jgi:hypothetical protein